MSWHDRFRRAKGTLTSLKAYAGIIGMAWVVVNLFIFSNPDFIFSIISLNVIYFNSS